MAKDIAGTLGIHPFMLYRWRMELKKGVLKENKQMKPKKASPKRLPNRNDPLAIQIDEVKRANKTEKLDLLKKAERFYAQKTKK